MIFSELDFLLEMKKIECFCFNSAKILEKTSRQVLFELGQQETSFAFISDRFWPSKMAAPLRFAGLLKNAQNSVQFLRIGKNFDLSLKKIIF